MSAYNERRHDDRLVGHPTNVPALRERRPGGVRPAFLQAAREVRYPAGVRHIRAGVFRHVLLPAGVQGVLGPRLQSVRSIQESGTRIPDTASAVTGGDARGGEARPRHPTGPARVGRSGEVAR